MEGGKGIIRLTPSQPMRIDIYGLGGDNRFSRSISDETNIKTAPGIYIVAAGDNGNGVKVVVE